MIAEARLPDLAPRLRRGELALREYLDVVFERIEAVELRVQALVAEPGRPQRVMREAAELGRRFPDPAGRPPLYGVLVGVKDIFHVDGLATRAGTRVPEEVLAGAQAESVTRLRKAGALVLGKTVTTEFAYFAPGPRTRGATCRLAFDAGLCLG